MAEKDESKLTSKIAKLAKDANKLKELVIKKQLTCFWRKYQN